MDRRIIENLAALQLAERGDRVEKHAPIRMSLLYPSPYTAAMSSLGYLTIHRLGNAHPAVRAERAVLPSPADVVRHRNTRTPLLTLESFRPAGDAHILAFSLAYELELAGLVEVLSLAGVAPLSKDRTAHDPLVIGGGPITFSNPLPTAPFADVMILGEAEGALEKLFDRIAVDPQAARGNADARRKLLEDLAGEPGFYVPALHGEQLPPIAQADDADLPAHSALWTPHTELHDMVLVEPERGCHRGCTFCVMRRSTNGGMRLFPLERVLAVVPKQVPRVGLVGAAVSDHPRIKDILRALIAGGKRIGISSLRADRLDDEFVGLLRAGGYKSMTVALDASSVRLRDEIEKNLKDRHVQRAAELARAHDMKHLKIYVILGLPGETDDDIRELAAFALELKKTVPIVLGVSPFVPKFKTPLADAPFMGEKEAHAALLLLRRLLDNKVEVRGPGAREAYVEYRLAQGGHQHAHAAIAAHRDGGGLGAWKRALRDLPERVRPDNFSELVPAATLRRRRSPSLALAPEAVNGRGTIQRPHTA